jgi:hypothetical protein
VEDASGESESDEANVDVAGGHDRQ